MCYQSNKVVPLPETVVVRSESKNNTVMHSVLILSKGITLISIFISWFRVSSRYW